MLGVWETKKESSVEAELFVYSTEMLELVDCLEHLPEVLWKALKKEMLLILKNWS